MKIKRFETGKTYKTVKCGNIKIIKRTAKTVTIKEINGQIVSRRIYIYESSECIKPFGNYSMAPVLRADRPAPTDSTEKTYSKHVKNDWADEGTAIQTGMTKEAVIADFTRRNYSQGKVYYMCEQTKNYIEIGKHPFGRGVFFEEVSN